MTTPEIAGLTDFTLKHESNFYTFWRAHQASLDRDVEVWQLASGLTQTQIDHQLRIARLLAKLNHSAVAHVYDVNMETTPPCVLAEITELPSLSDVVEQDGVFSAKRALEVAKGIAEAFAYIETQIPLVMRNLKPQNVFVDSKGGVKITGFSLAILANDPVDGPASDGDDIVGTPNFISPEHAAGAMDIDTRSDMYSLGTLLYYITTKQVPFDDPDVFKIFESHKSATLPNPQDFNKELTTQFVAFLSRLMMKDPKNRYASWGDLLADVKRLLENRPVIAKKLSPDAKSSVVIFNRLAEETSVPVEEKKAPIRRYPLLWFLLIVWLAWLANCRLMNPLGLPEKFAPQINIPQLDSLTEKFTAKSSSGNLRQPPEGALPEDNTVDVTRKVLQPVSSQTTVRSSSDPSEVSAASAPVSNTKTERAQVQQPAVVKEPAVSSDVLALANDIGEFLKDGNISGARLKCEQMSSDVAKEAAKLLAQAPDVDTAVGEAFMKKRGETITVTYMGKVRSVIPERFSGSTLVTKFKDANGNTREIPMALSKIDSGEKLSLIDRWAETPAQHVTAAVAALKAGNMSSFKRHAADAGILTSVFAALQ